MGELIFREAPAPIDTYSRGLINAAAVIKPHIILNWNDTILCFAAKSHGDKALIELFFGGIIVAQIVQSQFLILINKGIKPSYQSFLVLSTCISNTVFGVIMGEIVVGRTGITAVEGELKYFHIRETAFANQLAYRIRHIT